MLRRVTSLFHLCADGIVETKREEGETYIVSHRSAPYAQLVSSLVLTTLRYVWPCPRARHSNSRRLPINQLKAALNAASHIVNGSDDPDVPLTDIALRGYLARPRHLVFFIQARFTLAASSSPISSSQALVLAMQACENLSLGTWCRFAGCCWRCLAARALCGDLTWPCCWHPNSYTKTQAKLLHVCACGRAALCCAGGDNVCFCASCVGQHRVSGLSREHFASLFHVRGLAWAGNGAWLSLMG